MTVKTLLSTAYLPPIEYFSHIIDKKEVFIEKEENYLKQSYRNRCYILSSHGPQFLTVPVYLGSFHKTPVREIKIDYSKRWQQIHIRALSSSYRSSPFFIYYFETIEKIILAGHKALLDLNTELLRALLEMLKIEVKLSYTTDFMPVDTCMEDFRYTINPKKGSEYITPKYTQVFSAENGFVPGLSIVDLLFNMGPEAVNYL